MSDLSITAAAVSFSSCRICAQPWQRQGLPLGSLPVCNRFSAKAIATDHHDLTLDQCDRCGLVQLRKLPPVSSIVPRVPWIGYREPEGHLDATVAQLIERHLPAADVSFGVGPFEQPLLMRLAARGLRTKMLDVRTSCADAGTYPYLESWQSGLRASRIQDVARDAGQADIVSCRYIIEHCHDPVAALQGLQTLLKPGGLLLVEVPDSIKFLRSRDYCFLWEEHVSYFTEATARQLAARAGFELVELLRFDGQLEDALVLLLRPMTGGAPAAVEVTERDTYDRYARGYEHGRASVLAAMEACNRLAVESVALFGLGHQAIMFANMTGIAPLIAAAVDDDIHKNAHIAPGFSVPVTTSAELMEDRRIRTCLLAVNPSVEHKIKAKLSPLVERGVQFHSIFAGVPGSFLSELPPWR